MLLRNMFNIKFINDLKKKHYNYFFNNIYIYKLANENIKKGDLISFFIEKNQNFAKKKSIFKIKKCFNRNWNF